MKTAKAKVINLDTDMMQASCKLLGMTLAVLLFSWPMTNTVEATYGDLDLTFGIGGKVVTDFPGKFDKIKAIAIQADGKIVVAGSIFSATYSSDRV
ncbi:MAG TPA: hypothetical protein VF762_10750 [Blastocatellia bacterium]|jgi:hypothetical protein